MQQSTTFIGAFALTELVISITADPFNADEGSPTKPKTGLKLVALSDDSNNSIVKRTSYSEENPDTHFCTISLPNRPYCDAHTSAVGDSPIALKLGGNVTRSKVLPPGAPTISKLDAKTIDTRETLSANPGEYVIEETVNIGVSRVNTVMK
jgi:hypothetical protein